MLDEQSPRICPITMSSMDRIMVVLNIWANLTGDVRLRDRSVKSLQYGCQMLLGFYGSQFTEEFSTSLRLARRMGSNSRKAFWILKSINHAASAIHLVQKFSNNKNKDIVKFILDLLEQVSLVVYFGYENLVLLSRTQLLGPVLWPEDQLDRFGYVAWFVSDLAGFASTLLHVLALRRRQRQFSHLPPDTESVESGVVSLIISFLELAVSADYVGLWRPLLHRDLGDGYVGLAGTLSSVLTLAQAAAKASSEQFTTKQHSQ